MVSLDGAVFLDHKINCIVHINSAKIQNKVGGHLIPGKTPFQKLAVGSLQVGPVEICL